MEGEAGCCTVTLEGGEGFDDTIRPDKVFCLFTGHN